MENNEFRFCPDCGSRNIETVSSSRKWTCPDCGYTLYNNVASSVGLIIFNSKGECLLEKRAKDPGKGLLTVPGGFCDPGESLEEAAERECNEELGVSIGNLRYIISYPNVYPYKDMVYRTCDAFFSGKIPESAEFRPQISEVTECVWKKADSKEAVEMLPIAFESVKKALLKNAEFFQEEK